MSLHPAGTTAGTIGPNFQDSWVWYEYLPLEASHMDLAALCHEIGGGIRSGARGRPVGTSGDGDLPRRLTLGHDDVAGISGLVLPRSLRTERS